MSKEQEVVNDLYTEPDAAERERVLSIVSERVKTVHPGGANLSVVPENAFYENGGWYVPVLPDKQPPKRYEYYEALAGVSTELGRHENLSVLFVPVRPEETP